MTAGKGPLRFRRKFPRTQGIWHRSTRPAKPKEYRWLVGLCGYVVPPSIALFLGYELSTARIPAHGELCAKCEKRAREEELYEKHHEGGEQHDSGKRTNKVQEGGVFREGVNGA